MQEAGGKTYDTKGRCCRSRFRTPQLDRQKFNKKTPLNNHVEDLSAAFQSHQADLSIRIPHIMKASWDTFLHAGLTLLLLMRPTHSMSMDAWFIPDITTPQLIVYDEQTNNIFYSLCNSDEIPSYLGAQPAAFDLRFRPMNGTSVAGFGYWQASIPGIVVSGGFILSYAFSRHLTQYFEAKEIR
jgi:hypothetical protein